MPGHEVVGSTLLDQVPQIPAPAAGSFSATLAHSSFGTFDLQTIALVPEPGTGVLLALGLGLMGAARRTRA